MRLLPAGLAALLRRREQFLVAGERAAVAAALAQAPPELRARLEEMLWRAPGATRGAPEGSAGEE